MDIKNIKIGIKKYFTIWWIPIASYLVPIVFFLLGVIFRRDIFITIFSITFFLNILWNIISAIVQIFIKKWYLLIPQILITGLLYCVVSFVLIYDPPDYYGAHKEIPTNIKFSKPTTEKPSKYELEHNRLILTQEGQPGIYEYYTTFNPKEKGYFYIKAFEVTSNDELSEYEIKKRSKVEIESIKPQLSTSEFTIFEGSWGDKYGARIELWFHPKNGQNDIKITERNYIVEGWMR